MQGWRMHKRTLLNHVWFLLFFLPETDKLFLKMICNELKKIDYLDILRDEGNEELKTNICNRRGHVIGVSWMKKVTFNRVQLH